MEIRRYLLLVQRWLWLILLGCVLGGAIGYGISLYQTPVYRTSSKVLVSQPGRDQASELSPLASNQLSQTYAQILVTDPILKSTGERLGYAISPSQVSVKQIPETQILVLTVTGTERNRVADIANTMIEVLIEYNESLVEVRFASTEESLQNQINIVQDQIQALQEQADAASSITRETQLAQLNDQISELQDQIVTLQVEIYDLEQPGEIVPGLPTPTVSPEVVTALQEKQLELQQLEGLLGFYQNLYFDLLLAESQSSSGNPPYGVTQTEETLALYNTIYSDLLSQYETVRLARLENTPNVVQVEGAQAPTAPISPRPFTNMVLGLVMGVVLAAGIGFIIEMLDDTIKTPEAIERSLEVPVVGYISDIPAAAEGEEQIYVARHPRSPIAEAFRSLRTNLEFAGAAKPLQTVLITSPDQDDGKSTIVANLAAVTSQGGNKKVFLLDGDMRRPSIHKMLGRRNRIGLSDYFRNARKLEEVTRVWKLNPNLQFISSGDLPPNPAELLGSEKMDELLGRLKEDADLVLLDCPPFLVTDPMVLSSKVDGVVLVVKHGKTHLGAARSIVEQLRRANVRLVGIVINQIPKGGAYYYREYSPYFYARNSTYYTQGSEEIQT